MEAQKAGPKAPESPTFLHKIFVFYFSKRETIYLEAVIGETDFDKRLNGCCAVSMIFDVPKTSCL
jgi:hypothetical protein